MSLTLLTDRRADQIVGALSCEYATDLVFRRQADLGAICGNLTRTAIHTVKPDNIATFLGRKWTGNYQGEMGNRFNVRIEGTRIKHSMGPVSIKLYDKFGLILRIETTVKDVSFFKHYRQAPGSAAWREIRLGRHRGRQALAQVSVGPEHQRLHR